jgi:hypothetical protein
MEETQEERRKRQCREATARWRARHKDEVRASAKARRLANLDEMRRRDREAQKRRYDANPEEARARAKAFVSKNREPARIRSAEWRKANPERAKELSLASRRQRKERWEEFLAWERARYHKDPAKKLQRQKAARADPVVAARLAAYQREYAKSHPDVFAIRCAFRKAAKLNATPPWCDLDAVAEVYQRARKLSLATGIAYEVDHIIPLRSKRVCGLHIPQNLQILTRTENRRKHNKLIHGETGSESEVGL